MCFLVQMQRQGMTSSNPVEFVLCQWQHDRTSPSVMYLIYRWLVALVFMKITIISFILDCKYSCWKSFIYFAYWSIILSTVQAWLAAYICTDCFLKKLGTDPESSPQMKYLSIYRCYWCWYIISTDSACIATTLYWVFVYSPHKVFSMTADVCLYVVNLVLMLVDLGMVSHPFLFCALLPTICFESTYAFFTIVYYVSGGTNREGRDSISNIIDWNYPSKTFLIIGAMFGCTIAFHLMCFGGASLRRHVYRRRYESPVEDSLQMKESHKV